MTRFGLTKLDTMAKEKFRVCEHIMPGDVEIAVTADLSKSMWDLAVQPLKTYHYYHAYGLQI